MRLLAICESGVGSGNSGNPVSRVCGVIGKSGGVVSDVGVLARAIVGQGEVGDGFTDDDRWGGGWITIEFFSDFLAGGCLFKCNVCDLRFEGGGLVDIMNLVDRPLDPGVSFGSVQRWPVRGSSYDVAGKEIKKLWDLFRGRVLEVDGIVGLVDRSVAILDRVCEGYPFWG